MRIGISVFVLFLLVLLGWWSLGHEGPQEGRGAGPEELAPAGNDSQEPSPDDGGSSRASRGSATPAAAPGVGIRVQRASTGVPVVAAKVLVAESTGKPAQRESWRGVTDARGTCPLPGRVTGWADVVVAVWHPDFALWLVESRGSDLEETRLEAKLQRRSALRVRVEGRGVPAARFPGLRLDYQARIPWMVAQWKQGPGYQELRAVPGAGRYDIPLITAEPSGILRLVVDGDPEDPQQQGGLVLGSAQLDAARLEYSFALPESVPGEGLVTVSLRVALDQPRIVKFAAAPFSVGWSPRGMRDRSARFSSDTQVDRFRVQLKLEPGTWRLLLRFRELGVSQYLDIGEVDEDREVEFELRGRQHPIAMPERGEETAYTAVPVFDAKGRVCTTPMWKDLEKHRATIFVPEGAHSFEMFVGRLANRGTGRLPITRLQDALTNLPLSPVHVVRLDVRLARPGKRVTLLVRRRESGGNWFEFACRRSCTQPGRSSPLRLTPGEYEIHYRGKRRAAFRVPRNSDAPIVLEE